MAFRCRSYLSGDDPYNYPDVDWMDRFMKKSSVVQRYNVSVRGGTERVRYYASVGYVDNSGLYNVDKNANTYKTNANPFTKGTCQFNSTSAEYVRPLFLR